MIAAPIIQRFFWLYDQDEHTNHDKVWMIEVRERDDGWIVRRRWGRRGCKLAEKVEMFGHTAIVDGVEGVAHGHALRMIAEKEAKGYEEIEARHIGVETFD